MTDEKPRKTLSIKRKPANTGTDTTSPDKGAVKRAGKRIIKREDLPANKLTRPGKLEKPKKSTQAKHRRQPPKPKKTPPSDLRAQELNDSLNVYSVWREYKPLALGIERQIYQYIGKHSLSASKRLVQKLLHRHTHHRDYLQAISCGNLRYNLDGTETKTITQPERDHAARMLAT